MLHARVRRQEMDCLLAASCLGNVLAECKAYSNNGGKDYALLECAEAAISPRQLLVVAASSHPTLNKEESMDLTEHYREKA